MQEKIKSRLKWFFESFIWLGVLMLILDVVSKLIIYACRADLPHLLIPHVLNIEYSLNPNAAFSMGFDNPIVNRVMYTIVALGVTAGIIVFLCLKYKKTTMYTRACMMLIMAGALGNMFDRTCYAFSDFCVIDWIDFSPLLPFWKYTFNWADSCVVVGAIMLIVWLIIDEVKTSKANKAIEKAEENSDEKVLSASEKERIEEDKKQ